MAFPQPPMFGQPVVVYVMPQHVMAPPAYPFVMPLPQTANRLPHAMQQGPPRIQEPLVPVLAFMNPEATMPPPPISKRDAPLVVTVQYEELAPTNKFLYTIESEPIIGKYVVVQAQRGRDIGRIVSVEPQTASNLSSVTMCVLRTATSDDIGMLAHPELLALQSRILASATSKAESLGLSVKFLACRMQFEGAKANLYYTSLDEKWEYRQFVNLMYREFKLCVWLHQVSPPVDKATDEDETSSGSCESDLPCDSDMTALIAFSAKFTPDAAPVF